MLVTVSLSWVLVKNGTHIGTCSENLIMFCSHEGINTHQGQLVQQPLVHIMTGGAVSQSLLHPSCQQYLLPIYIVMFVRSYRVPCTLQPLDRMWQKARTSTPCKGEGVG